MTYPAVPLDIVTRLFIDDTWVDFTSDVRGPSVAIKGRGSSSEQVTPNAHTVSLMLNDRQGKYVDQNPNSIYFDKLGTNVPMRVSVRPHHTTGPLADVSDTFERGGPLNANPYFTSGTSGWSVTGASLTPNVDNLLVTPDGVTSTVVLQATTRVAVTAGNQYVAILRVNSPNGWSDMRPAVDWWTAVSGGSFISGDSGSAFAVAAGKETYLIATYTAPGGAGGAVIRGLQRLSPAVTDTWYVLELSLQPDTGWAQPDSGQAAYEGWGGGGTIASNNFRTNKGKGVHYVPASNAYRVSSLEDLHCVDLDQTITFTCPQAVGAALEPAGIIFRGTDYLTYDLARVEVLTDNTVYCKIIDRDGTVITNTSVSGLTHLGTSQPLKLRVLVMGHDVYMKVWIASNSQPEAWHAHAYLTSIPVYGWKGIRSGVANGNTNTKPVEFTYDDLTMTFEEPRSCAEVAEWPSSWDSTGTDVYIPIVGAGLRRRLSKGAKPLRSPHTRSIIAASTPPDAYWPLEDPSDASQATSGVANGTPMLPANSTAPPSFGNTGIILGSASHVSFTDGGTLIGTNNNWVFKGIEFAIDFVIGIDGPANGAITDTLVLEWYSSGSHSKFECHCSNNSIEVKHFNSAGTQLAAATANNVTVFAKQPKHIRYHSQQNGLNYLSRLYIDGVLAATATGTLVGLVREITTVVINPLGATGLFAPSAVSQLAIWGASAPSVVDMAAAARGYLGETAADRLVRLGQENGFTVDIRGTASDSTAMGPQPTDTLLKIMDLTAQTDMGVLYESRFTLGFEFHPRADVYNITGLDLSYTSKLFSNEIKPITDDRLLVNSITAQRYGGGEYTYALTEGKRSIQDYPNGAGLYEVSLDFNTESSAGLAAPTQFAVARGTVLERISIIKFNLARSVFTANSELTAQILALDIMHRLNITDMPSWLPPKDYPVLIQGCTEIISGLGTWEIELNTIPFEPFRAAIWESSRFDTDNSTTASAITSGTTTAFDVATTAVADLWITGSGSPEFPIQIKIAGVVFNVTAISGSSSPQTFTVDATPVNNVVKSIPLGSKVSLHDPDYFSY